MQNPSHRPKVLITDMRHESAKVEKRILKDINARIKIGHCETPKEVVKLGSKAQALLVSYAPITKEVYNKLDNLKVVAKYGMGVDNIDLEGAKEHGVMVTNVPDYCTDEVSDHTAALFLSLARHVSTFDRLVKDGKWMEHPHVSIPRLIYKKFGLIGFGKIGRKVGLKVRPFCRELLAFDPNVSDSFISSKGVKPVSLHRLLKEADFISIHVPLTPATKGLLNRSRLEMAKGSFIINTSRGEVVDQGALFELLKSGYLAGAALDVFTTEPPELDSEVMNLDNVIFTPHIAWYSEVSEITLRARAAKEVKRVLLGLPPKHPVS